MPPPTSAVARYARGVARLPSFAEEPWYIHVQQAYNGTYKAKDPVLRVVATNKVTGQVQPRAEDVWMALLPFDDLAKKKPADAADLLTKRMAFVELLVRLATSKRFGWHVPIFCGEHVGPLVDDQENAFWFSLFAELSQEWKLDTTVDMGRNLTVLTRQFVPRFLLCFTQTISSLNFPHLFDMFLSSAGTSDLREVATTSGLGEQDLERFSATSDIVIELGLRFTKGKITETIMAALLDCIQQAHTKGKSDLVFRVTTLHFGRLCTFHPKALELLCQRRGDCKSLVNIRLGSLQGVRPASLRSSLTSLFRSPTTMHRLTTCTDESFAVFASALRYGEKSSVEELDMVFTPTVEAAKWLAFGLFHADSQSKVSSLRLRIPLGDDYHTHTRHVTTEWIDIFNRILRSVRAEYDLGRIGDDDGDEEKAAIDRLFVKLQRSTRLKDSPYSGARVLIKLDDDEQAENEEFELVAREKASIAVVAPGFGLAWVPASSVVSERPVASASRTTASGAVVTNKRIKSFAWDVALPGYRGHRVDEMLDLLEIIGRPLKRLDLPRIEMTTANLTRLLELCPNLTELNVNGHSLTSIQPVVDAYVSGKCKISTVGIARPTPTGEGGYHFAEEDEASTIPEELRQLLHDQDSRSGPLRQLVVNCTPCHSYMRDFYSLEFQPLVAALDRCTQLAFVQLTSIFAYESHNGLDTEPFSVHTVALRHKLAFVSSIVDHHTSDPHSPLGLLDASVVGVIFRFCSEVVPRRAFVGMPLAFERKKCLCPRCKDGPWEKTFRESDMLARTVW